MASSVHQRPFLDLSLPWVISLAGETPCSPPRHLNTPSSIDPKNMQRLAPFRGTCRLVAIRTRGLPVTCPQRLRGRYAVKPRHRTHRRWVALRATQRRIEHFGAYQEPPCD